ncbi:transmembrane and TPR repeat-containing protein CG4050-like [Centruroides sculpturatus]|uniref:transmembrane and TPR repeat-containing protein CG4050-like n=1 Tax=Centruroides sculpturatus TaxID=218467 RepID=UPI000C6EEF8F|nr:transmembrane and TPR repeat-containing protein CG4050-like [Centruroides sculpturatus]
MKRSSEKMNRSPNDKRLSLHSIAVAIAAISCYYPSLQGDLVFDDIAAIKDNRDVRSHTPISNLFVHDFWGTPIHKEQSHKSYRPLTVLTYRWNYWLHGLQPWGYHAVNLLLHALVSLLYLRLCQRFLPIQDALVAALYFAVHPIHSDAVASIVGRTELLSAIFYIAAILSYMSSIYPDQKNKKERRCGVCFAIIYATVGTLCKEQALTSLIVCIAIDIFIFNQVHINRKCFYSMCRRKSSPWWNLVPVRINLIAASFIIILILRVKLMDYHFPYFNRLDNPAVGCNFIIRTLTQNYLVAFNAWLMAFPYSLSCDWSTESIPLVDSYVDSRNIATIFIYIIITLLVFQGISFDSKVLKLALVMLIVPYLPASNLLFHVGFVVAERVLYLPSMGMGMIFALGVNKLRSYGKFKVALNGAICFLLLTYCFRTARRCYDWETDYALYKSGLQVNPRNVKLLNNVGQVVEKLGKYKEAIGYYIKAISTCPEDVTAYLNLGNVYTKLKRYQEAEKAYQHAKSLLPQHKEGNGLPLRVTRHHLKALVHLAGLISQNSSRIEEADKMYAQVTNMRSDYTEAYVSWSDLMLKQNRTREAEVFIQKAMEEDSEDPNMLYNLGIILSKQGKHDPALQRFDRAVHLDPLHVPSLIASARIIVEEGFTHLHQVAFSRLQKVVENGRADETVYFHLAMLAIKSGDHYKAEGWLNKALELRFNFPEALFNMALLLYQNNRLNEAATYLQMLLKHGEGHVKGLLLLGDIYVTHIGDLEAGEICYQMILRQDPRNYQGLHNLCVVYLQRNELRQAVDCFQEALRLAPHVSYIQRHLYVAGLLLEKEENGTDYRADILRSRVEVFR